LFERGKQVFVDGDHDHDGFLSVQDVFSLIFFFAVADTDLSGNLSWREYVHTWEGEGRGNKGGGEGNETDLFEGARDSDVRFASKDRNGQGSLIYTEWYALVAPPAWIVISGFNSAKRRDFMLRFCQEIEEDRDPCTPETMQRLRAQVFNERCSLA